MFLRDDCLKKKRKKAHLTPPHWLPVLPDDLLLTHAAIILISAAANVSSEARLGQRRVFEPEELRFNDISSLQSYQDSDILLH